MTENKMNGFQVDALKLMRSMRTISDKYRVDLNDETPIEPNVLADVNRLAEELQRNYWMARET